MSFFSRLSDIVTSNIDHLLEKAENPEATLKQIVCEMERGVESAKRSASTALTNARRLKTELDNYRGKIAFWDAKAREAVELGRDDLARRALGRRRELEDLSGALEQQYDAALTAVNNLKTTLRALEARLSETARRQTGTCSMATAGTSQTEAYGRSSSKPPDGRPADRASQIEKLERDIAKAETEIVMASAVAEAESQLEQSRQEIDERRDLESELAALKRDIHAQA